MAIGRSKVKIYITPAGTNPSSVTSANLITGEIISYNKSGGEEDVESVPAFGGFIDKEKPQTQYQLEFEIVPQLTADTGTTMRWESLTYYNDAGTFTSAGRAGERMVVIEAGDGTSFKSSAFNNCKVTVLDTEHSADDNQTYNLSLKLSPQTPEGIPNVQGKAVSATSLSAWAALKRADQV